MTKKRWVRFYFERWRDGTFGLTPNEIAAYITVLCELYDKDGLVIQPDFELMARRCGMRPTSFRKAFDALSRRGKLSLDGEILTAKAVSEEIKSREKLGEKSDESRRKLAKKRKENNEILRKIPSNIEYRTKNNSSTLDVVAPSEEDEGAPDMRGMAGFIKRRELNRRRLS